MNELQLCSVTKSLLSLHSVLLFLHDSSILCTVLLLKSIYLNDLPSSDYVSKPADQRLQLLLKLANRSFEELTSVFFKFFCQQLPEIKWCNFSHRLPLTCADLLEARFCQELKVLKLWICRSFMNKVVNTAQAIPPSLPVFTDLFSSDPSQ